MDVHDEPSLELFFLRTITEVDERLPLMTQGLGVVDNQEARYYPLKRITAAGIVDSWHGRLLQIKRQQMGQIPVAIWQDNGTRPFQLLSRWYGFSYTYPNCAIFQ